MGIQISALHVRRSSFIEATAEHVWEEFKSFERLAACQVELFHHGFERLGADAGAELQGYESGWDSRHLGALEAIVEA